MSEYPKTMWKILFYGLEIEEIKVVKETPSFVTVERPAWTMSGNKMRLDREARVSQYNSIHETWEEARRAIVARFERDVEHAKDALQKARSGLGQAQSLVDPSAQRDRGRT